MASNNRWRRRTYSDELTLLYESTTYDELGRPTTVTDENVVLCSVESVGSNEFYEASVQGLKPERTFVIHSLEYSGERDVVFRGQKYAVIRTYETDYEEVELTCEVVVRDGKRRD